MPFISIFKTRFTRQLPAWAAFLACTSKNSYRNPFPCYFLFFFSKRRTFLWSSGTSQCVRGFISAILSHFVTIIGLQILISTHFYNSLPLFEILFYPRLQFILFFNTSIGTHIFIKDCLLVWPFYSFKKSNEIRCANSFLHEKWSEHSDSRHSFVCAVWPFRTACFKNGKKKNLGWAPSGDPTTTILAPWLSATPCSMYEKKKRRKAFPLRKLEPFQNFTIPLRNL